MGMEDVQDKKKVGNSEISWGSLGCGEQGDWNLFSRQWGNTEFKTGESCELIYSLTTGLAACWIMSIQRGWGRSSQASEEPPWNSCFSVQLSCLSHPVCSLLLSGSPTALLGPEMSVLCGALGVSALTPCTTASLVSLLSFTSRGHMLAPPKSAFSEGIRKKEPLPGDPPYQRRRARENTTQIGSGKIKGRCTGGCNQEHKDVGLASGMAESRGSNDVTRNLSLFSICYLHFPLSGFMLRLSVFKGGEVAIGIPGITLSQLSCSKSRRALFIPQSPRVNSHCPRLGHRHIPEQMTMIQIGQPWG